jgi:hypothetical protein
MKPDRRKYTSSTIAGTTSPPPPRTRKAASVSICSTIHPKLNASGRKIVASTVSCFMTTLSRLETVDR